MQNYTVKWGGEGAMEDFDRTDKQKVDACMKFLRWKLFIIFIRNKLLHRSTYKNLEALHMCETCVYVAMI